MFKLDSTLQFALLHQPESGMGYQIVTAVVSDSNSKIKHGIAYNAELLLFEEEPRVILKENYERLLAAAKISTGEIIWLNVKNVPSISPAFVLNEAIATNKARPAKDASVEKTKQGEVFKRFTAYEIDHRITPDGRLLPDTYATTEADARHVRTGKQAVARYALPNPKPASNKWTIRPHKDTFIQCGIVEPAFGQPGGGVEVIFTKGTDAGTVEPKPEKIPDDLP
jgi:hypothetical protein